MIMKEIAERQVLKIQPFYLFLGGDLKISEEID